MAKNPRRDTKNLIISPHCDDAMLSLGSTIINKSLGSFSIVNVFTRTNYTISGNNHIDFVTKLRKEEEYSVMSKLNIEVDFLDFDDACIRQPYSNHIDSYLEQHIDPYSDLSFFRVRRTIRKVLEKFISCLIFFPLAIGNHIDHRICYLIAVELLKQRMPIFFYEDIPYSSSLNDHELKRMISQLEIDFEDIVIKSDDCTKKLAMLKLYHSQIDNEIERRILEAFNIHQGERIWSTSDNLKLLNIQQCWVENE